MNIRIESVMLVLNPSSLHFNNLKSIVLKLPTPFKYIKYKIYITHVDLIILDYKQQQ